MLHLFLTLDHSLVLTGHSSPNGNAYRGQVGGKLRKIGIDLYLDTRIEPRRLVAITWVLDLGFYLLDRAESLDGIRDPISRSGEKHSRRAP